MITMISRAAGQDGRAHPGQDLFPFFGRPLIEVIRQVPGETTGFRVLHLGRNQAGERATPLQARPQIAGLQLIAMLDDVEDLQAGRRLRDLQPTPPGCEGRPVRQPAGDHDGPVQAM
ncbi:hypothetical protein D3C72_1067630 [compost metagenome]